MKKFIISVVTSALILISGQGIAADIEAGKKKAIEVCAACHGPDGNSLAPAFPKLAGQHGAYIENTLNGYKSGDRKNLIMNGLAANLSKEDIQNLALYFSRQSGLSTKK